MLPDLPGGISLPVLVYSSGREFEVGWSRLPQSSNFDNAAGIFARYLHRGRVSDSGLRRHEADRCEKELLCGEWLCRLFSSAVSR